MAVILSETFSADPGGAFATPLVDSGGVLTATYNGAQQAMDLDRVGYNSVWRLDTCPLVRNSRAVLDLEVVSNDRGGATVSGVGLAWYSSSLAYWHILAVSTEGLSVILGRGSTIAPLGFGLTINSRASMPVPTSGRRVYEFTNVDTETDFGRQVKCVVDGADFGLLTYPAPAGEDLRLGVFVRDSTYRVHSIEVQDDAVAAPMPVSAEGGYQVLPTDVVTQPVAPLLYSPLLNLGDKVYGGRGKIVGTVKRAEVPANVPLGRKVRLFRDRDAVCVREAWSDPVTGAYSFVDIDPVERYSVVAYDYQGVFRAVIADNLLPDPL